MQMAEIDMTPKKMIDDDDRWDVGLEYLLSDSEQCVNKKDLKSYDDDYDDQIVEDELLNNTNYVKHNKTEKYFMAFNNNNANCNSIDEKKMSVSINKINSLKDKYIDHNDIDKLSNGKNELQLSNNNETECKLYENNSSNVDDKDVDPANEEDSSKLKSSHHKSKSIRHNKRKSMMDKRIRRLTKEDESKENDDKLSREKPTSEKSRQATEEKLIDERLLQSITNNDRDDLLDQEYIEMKSIAKNMDEINTRQKQSLNEETDANSSKKERNLRNTPSNEDLLQVMDVPIIEECAENKENTNEDDKNNCDKDSNEDKRNSLDKLSMDIEKGNVTLEEELSNKDNQKLREDNTIAINNKRQASTLLKEQFKKRKLYHDEKILTNFKSLSEYMLSSKIPRLTRTDLEELCMQKIVEVLSISSENSEARHKIKALELQIEQNRKETQQISRQYRELHIVHNRLLTELTNHRRTDKCVLPIKITRSVGIQTAIIDKKLIKPNCNNNTPLTSPINNNNTVQQQKTVVMQGQEQPQNSTNINNNQIQQIKPIAEQTIAVNKSNINIKQNKISNNVNKRDDVVDLTGDDERMSNASTTTTTKSLNKMFSSVSTVSTVGTTSNIITTQSSTANEIDVNTEQRLSAPPVLTTPLTSSTIPTTNGPLRSLQLYTGAIKVRNPAPFEPTPPLPLPPSYQDKRSTTLTPPKPLLNLSKSGCGTCIVLQWKMLHDLSKYEIIASYQLFAYQEKCGVVSKTDDWSKIGDVKALALPMAVTLKQFAAGNRYLFAVRAVDVLDRIGSFSDPCSILL